MQSAMGRQGTLDKVHDSEEEAESDTAVLNSDGTTNRSSKVKLTPPTPSDGSPPHTPNTPHTPPSYHSHSSPHASDRGGVIV